jgi:hypothetical protein
VTFAERLRASGYLMARVLKKNSALRAFFCIESQRAIALRLHTQSCRSRTTL